MNPRIVFLLILTLGFIPAISASSSFLTSSCNFSTTALGGTWPPSPGTYTVTPVTVGPFPGSGIVLAIFAMEVSLDIIAIGYIISKIFPQTGIGSWLRNEWWELAKSGLIIVGIYAILTFMGNVSVVLFGSTLLGQSIGVTTGSYTATLGELATGAEIYLCSAFVTIAQPSGALNYLGGINLGQGVLTSINVGAWLPIPPFPLPPPAGEAVGFAFGFTFAPFQNNILFSAVPGTSGTYESAQNDLLNLLVFPVTLIIATQTVLVGPIVNIALLVLIPLGIVLRSFPFIRGVGGTLVAMGIGLAIIYPSILILFNAPITSQLASTSIITGGTGWTCNAGGGVGWLVCPFFDFLKTLLTGNTGYNDGVASFYNIYPALNGMLIYSAFFVEQFILFVLDLAIFYIITDGIARMLGGSFRTSISRKINLL